MIRALPRNAVMEKKALKAKRNIATPSGNHEV